ncbi:MAG: S41 family peptidase, partial [Rhodanobacteraceae bacterium]
PAPASASPPAAPSPAPTPADPLDQLAASDLRQALSFIKKNYVRPGAVDPTDLDRATLAGLIERLGRGVTLLSSAAAKTEASPAPSYREILAGHIGYLRPGALRKNDLSDLDAALKLFASKKVDALVLDLRGTTETQDYAMAAEFADRFARKGGILFAVRGATQEPRIFTAQRSPGFVGFVAVLIDQETAGASEVLASVLRARDKAILIGQATADAAVGYSDLALPDGVVLRVAVEEVVLADQRIGFPNGVEPDLPVTMGLAEKRQVFKESLTKGMAQFVFEADRPHLNEAALLAGTNPEIEAFQEAQRRRARGEKPPLRDPVVQRAVDVITSIGVFEAQASPTP